MASWLRDEGDVSVFLDDTGQEVRVAKDYAQPYMPPPSLGGDVAPAGAIDQAQLFNVQTGAPNLPEGIETPPPPVPEPAPGPETLPAAPAEVAPPPPDIAPTGPLNRPTQVAGAIIDSKQDQANSAYRQAEAGADAANQIVQGSATLDTSLDRIEQERKAEAEQRRQDELVLRDDYKRKVERYANWRVDPNRGMSDAAQAGQWIMAAIAGVGSAMKGQGDKNPALEVIKGNLAERVNLQMIERDQLGSELALKKEAIADFKQGTQDRNAEFNLRMAGEMEKYGRMVDRVKTKLGSEVEREAASQVAAGLKAEAAQLQGHAVAQETEARARARAARQQAVMKAQAAAEQQRRWMAEHNIVGVDPQTGLYVKGGPEGTLEGQKEQALTTKAQADAAKAVLEGSPQERERTLGVGGLKREDGTPVLMRSTDEAAKVSKLKAATDTAAQLTDKLLAAREKYGWSSDLMKSKEWRQMKADYAALQLEIKNTAELGVLAGPDMDLIGGYLGTEDPTEARDPKAGIEESRANLVNKFNSTLKANDAGAARYEPPKLAALEAVESKVTDNLGVAFAPFNDLTKSDSTKLHNAQEARKAAYDEVARQSNPDTLRLAARKLQAQHAAGEVDDKTYEAIRTKLARSVLRRETEADFAAGPGTLAGSKTADTRSKGWEDRLLFGGAK